MKNIIWDFDGTLFDTYPQMVNSFLLALNKMHIDDFEIDEYEIYEIMRRHSLSTAIQKYSAHFNLDPEKLRKNYSHFENQNVLNAKPFQNAESLLKNSVDNGMKNFILTHRDQETLLKLLNNNHLSKCFEDIVDKDSDFPRKPNPASINHLIEVNKLDRYATMMIGDRIIDIKAGLNAGIKTVLFDPDAIIIEKSNADYQFSNMYDLNLFLNDSKKDK
ncbi:HAD-IA family hydrolase [Apilactobacillus ozensis]|uniref:HAD-IA family hydrolase n=1 Tax=Apilactobacillus ozensis TaxID=866801 RepID=UPI00200B2868|nr:HAD-IA family hydrolase [Apilactobacillus ozensis]MCK8606890.1 HAD-IA family hydrolase [Apilactobacillus ozensis]